MAIQFTSVAATEVQKNFGYYQDQALKSPVLISKNGRPKTVLISYEEFVNNTSKNREMHTVENMPEELVEEIMAMKAPNNLRRKTK